VSRSASWKVAVLLILVAVVSFALGYYAMERFIL
jgi:hypothetical protein